MDNWFGPRVTPLALLGRRWLRARAVVAIHCFRRFARRNGCTAILRHRDVVRKRIAPHQRLPGWRTVDGELSLSSARPPSYNDVMTVYTAAAIYEFALEAGFTPDQAVTMTAIALAESGGDSRAHNPVGEDSRGLWQINVRAHSGWLGESDLYDPATNAKAAFRVSNAGQDISPWTVTHGESDARYLQYKQQAQAAAVMHGDDPQLGVWTGSEGYGHPVSAGDGDAVTSMSTGSDAGPTLVDRFLEEALAQAGDEYVFGAPSTDDDPDPDVWDCSELVKWAAGRVGLDVPDGTWLQYLYLKEQGALIPVDEAVDTPGALLFNFSTEPTRGGGRPSTAHVAISLGNGQTIEARNSKYDVGSWGAEGRFNYAAVIPGLGADLSDDVAPVRTFDIEGPDPARYADAEQIDTDLDSLLDAMEEDYGLDPNRADTDSDNLSDSYEMLRLGTDPTKADSDRDSVADSVEIALGTDPLDPDTDRDGFLDASEGRAEAEVDSDKDRLSDELEVLLGTDPGRIDSDFDGIVDGSEYFAGFDAADASSVPAMGFEDDPGMDEVMDADVTTDNDGAVDST